MSGETGDQPTTSPPAASSLDNASRRDLKARIWLGLPLAVAGGYLVGDTTARLELAWKVFVTWWPWVLLLLAAANVARSVFRLASLVGPGLMAFAAAMALALRQGVASATVVDIVIPAVIALTGIGLLLSTGSWLGESWARILVTGSVRVPEKTPRVLRPKAILGELSADLSSLAKPPEEIHVTVVFGHVRLRVPPAWKLDLHAAGAPITAMRGKTGVGPPAVALRVIGFGGVVSVDRANPSEKDALEA